MRAALFVEKSKGSDVQTPWEPRRLRRCIPPPKIDGVGQAVGGWAGKTFGADGGKFVTGVLSGVAGDIAGAATRSALDGSDLGGNILAGIPDAIGQTIGNTIAGGIEQAQSHGASLLDQIGHGLSTLFTGVEQAGGQILSALSAPNPTPDDGGGARVDTSTSLASNFNLDVGFSGSVKLKPLTQEEMDVFDPVHADQRDTLQVMTSPLGSGKLPTNLWFVQGNGTVSGQAGAAAPAGVGDGVAKGDSALVLTGNGQGIGGTGSSPASGGETITRQTDNGVSEVVVTAQRPDNSLWGVINRYVVQPVEGGLSSAWNTFTAADAAQHYGGYFNYTAPSMGSPEIRQLRTEQQVAQNAGNASANSLAMIGAIVAPPLIGTAIGLAPAASLALVTRFPVTGAAAMLGQEFGYGALYGASAAGAGGVLIAKGGIAAESAVPQVTANRIAGNAFRDELAGALRAEGRDVTTEVYKSTPFGKRFIDIEVSKDGQVLGGIETKVGTSRYTWQQQLKDWWLKNAQGYTVNVARDK